MHAATESPCDPAALAAAVRTLARDAHLALKGPHTEATLAEPARRAEALKGCLAGRTSVPLGPWLNSLAVTLGHAESEECARGHLAFRRDFGRVPPAGVRAASPGYLSGLRRASA